MKADQEYLAAALARQVARIKKRLKDSIVLEPCRPSMPAERKQKVPRAKKRA